MGRSTAKSWQSAPKAVSVQRRRGKAASVAADYEASDSEDEDVFEKRRDKISLSGGRGGKAADDDDDLDDEEVMGLGDGDDDDEEEDDEVDDDGNIDDEDEDALIEEALERGGKSAERKCLLAWRQAAR
jgi:hypothetical protein